MTTRIRMVLRSLRKADPIWRYYSNFSPVATYALDLSKGLNRTESRIVRHLVKHGIAISSVEDLNLDSPLFEGILSATDSMLRSRQSELEELEKRADDSQTLGSKSFNYEMLGSEPEFQKGDIFASLGLNPCFLRIANAYLKMHAKLRYYNVWKTFASAGRARESQLWHFDREDNYILKVFLYLDDVDEGAGPFTYAPGTHKKGKYRSIKPEYFLEGGVRRTTDEQMNSVYPRDKWVRAVGKKGTIIFADTRGYHKGGEARTKDRLMFTCMYTSPASESKRLIVYPEGLDLTTFTPQQRRALQHK